MSTARYIIGDVFEVMAALPDDSVDVVITSPPFLALRSYLPSDHPDKHKEIGSEPTPAEFLDTLLALTAEWGRLIAPHGSIAVELGDTYSGSATSVQVAHDRPQDGGYASADRVKQNGHKSGIRNMNDKRQGAGPGWPLDKSLCIIPELYAACLAYGRNVLTGEPSPAGQWRVRNLVRWVRPNPPVGALGDKYRPATSTMVVACRARDRWFDLDAVRTELKSGNEPGQPGGSTTGYRGITEGGARTPMESHPAGAPPLDWWNIPTQPYKGAHYATWPARLCETPIESMCPREVCATCGEPRRRIVDAKRIGGKDDSTRTKETGRLNGHDHPPEVGWEYERTTLGWTIDCDHGNYRPGIVLDPFAGSGTTLAVATGHGRDAIGIDIDARNADLAVERVGMFLTVNHNEETEDSE